MSGTALAALGVVAVLGALAPMVGRLRRTRTGTPGRASDRAVLTFAASRLEELARAAAAGWTPETLRDAHASARLVAGVLMGDGVRQSRIKGDDDVPEGRLRYDGRLGRVHAALTAPATVSQVTQALDALPASAGPERRQQLERLRDSLGALSRAQFSQHTTIDERGPIDDAVAAAADVARSAARTRLMSPRPWFRRAEPARPTVDF